MKEEISITLDGLKVNIESGKTVLEAAIEAGIYLPYLCYHPGMKPFAACRMCVVEVEGGRGFPASCTLPVQEGMVVKTNSNEVHKLRRSIMELLISEHPHGCLTCHRVDLCGPQDICLRHVSVNDRCVTCPKNERCELKDTARYLNLEIESPLPYKYKNIPIETGDPFYDRDYNLCIVCGRCVRVCEEIRGDNAITFTERGGKALVGTSHGTSLLESGCEFCGACLDVCPVGALVETNHKWEKATRVKKTICPHCTVGCQMNLEINKFDKVIRVIPELNSPSNRGQACFKGKFGLDFVNHKQRLDNPMVRRGDTLEEVSWNEALDVIAERMPNYKGDMFGIMTAPDSTNEEHYIAQKFARAVMVSNNIDQTSNVSPNLAWPLKQSLGYASATNPIWDLEESQCIIAFSSNITEEQNVAAIPIKKAVKNGSTLIVIDSREVELTRYAEIWLRPKPGSELLVLGAMLKHIIDSSLVDKDYVQSHCNGWEALYEYLQTVDLDDIVSKTGVSRTLIENAAKEYATAETSSLVYALDNILEEIQNDCVHAIANLCLLTGNLGKPNAGLYPLRKGANEQGAWDMGCVPFLLPGYLDIYKPDERHFIEDHWGTIVPIEHGRDLDSMISGIVNQDIKAMFVMGDEPLFNNPVPGMEKPSDVANKVLEPFSNLDFLVVSSYFDNALTKHAHVILPRSTFAEKDGTYTNIERRVQRLTPVLSKEKPGPKPDWWIVCQIARRMNASGFNFEDASAILDEIALVVPSYGGISMNRLEDEAILVAKPDDSNPLPIQLVYSTAEHPGLQWPCQQGSTGGTPLLYEEGFPGGKANLYVPDLRPATYFTSDDYPFLLVPGRVLLQSQREMSVQRAQLNSIVRDELVEIHPDDARQLGFTDGDMVEVRTPLSGIKGKIVISANIHRQMVSSTGLFGQLAVELEANDEFNPMSRVEGLWIRPASITKVHQ